MTALPENNSSPPAAKAADPATNHQPAHLHLVHTNDNTIEFPAVQVHDEIVKLSHGRRVHCVAVYGGKPIRGQIEKLNKGAQIVVGTPGRVLDHLARGTINFASLKIALPRAVSAAIIGEFLVGDAGLGFLIESSRQSIDTTGVFAGVVVATALVLAINAVLVRIDRRFSAWRPADRHMEL